VTAVATKGQFQQHFTRAFCVKKSQSQNVTREKLGKAHLFKKCSRKMLIKLTLGCHFIYIYAGPEQGNMI